MKYVFCIVLPPLAILPTGQKLAFLFNILLTVCGWIPGVVHAILVVNAAESERRHRELLAAVRESSKPPS